MPFKANPVKEDMIMKFGETYGLPLFEQKPASGSLSSSLSSSVKLPDWIWTGNGIKAQVYAEMINKFADDSLLYLRALIDYGGHATDHEIKEFFNDVDKWPLHIVSARRNYFTGNPYYLVKSFPGQFKIGPKGKQNTIWFVDFKQLYKIIYEV